MERGLFQEEHIIFRQPFIRFLEKESAPYYGQWEKDGIVPQEIWGKAGENGYFARAVIARKSQ